MRTYLTHRLLGNLIIFVILVTVTIFTTRASLKPGMYPTHDSEIHLIRSLHFFSELQRGQFPVRMAPELAYSYGYSTFQFFYPLPYYATALIQILGFSTVTSWKVMQILATFSSIALFYLWLRCHVGKLAALSAATLFGVVPFRLLTLYVTGQIGGYLALVFAPLIGLGLNLLLSQKNPHGGVLLSLGVAGISLSHLLSAIIFFVPLAGYCCWLLFYHFSWKKIGLLLGWGLLGVGLASFYLIPFLLEKSWVRLGHQILVDHRLHWPTFKQLIYSPWGYGQSNPGLGDDMSFQVGMGVFLTVTLSMLTIFLKRSVSLKNKTMTLGLVFQLTFFISFFLMLESSKIIWELFAPLQYLQFPWRLLAATSLCGSFLAGWLFDQYSGKLQLGLIILVLGLNWYNVRNYTRPWPLDWRSDLEYQQDLQAFYGPVDTSWELLPMAVTTPPKVTPPLVLNASVAQLEITELQTPPNGQVRKRLTVAAQADTEVNLAVWNLPVWQVAVDQNTVTTKTAADGTILIPVTAGTHLLELKLIKTQTQKIADVISLFSITLLITLELKLVIFSYKNPLLKATHE